MTKHFNILLKFQSDSIINFFYYVGPLGFLSTQDDVVPGNMGMKDQVMVLQWIQENIGNFGGDANRVTLFGESAGGASVHLHMISPMSKGKKQLHHILNSTYIISLIDQSLIFYISDVLPLRMNSEMFYETSQINIQ